jgi:hypothetical protein
LSAEIVKLHDAPLLTDIVGMLRRLADQIEAGEHGEVETLFAVMPTSGGYPRLFGWGDVSGQCEPLIQLELAKAWLVNNMTARI